MSENEHSWRQVMGRVALTFPDIADSTYALSAVLESAPLIYGASYGRGLQEAQALHGALDSIVGVGRPAVCVGSSDLTATLRQSFEGLAVKSFVFVRISPSGEAFIAGDGQFSSGDDWKRTLGAVASVRADVSYWASRERTRLAEKETPIAPARARA